LKGKVVQARLELERGQRVAKAKETQAQQELEFKKTVHQQEVIRAKESEEEIKRCLLRAPGS
jgi:hypothetical protein